MRADIMREQVMIGSIYSAEYYRQTHGSATVVTECDQGERIWVQSYASNYADGHATAYKYNIFTGFALQYY